MKDDLLAKYEGARWEMNSATEWKGGSEFAGSAPKIEKIDRMADGRIMESSTAPTEWSVTVRRDKWLLFTSTPDCAQLGEDALVLKEIASNPVAVLQI